MKRVMKNDNHEMELNVVKFYQNNYLLNIPFINCYF
jgi:hypothetical protein